MKKLYNPPTVEFIELDEHDVLATNGSDYYTGDNWNDQGGIW